MADLNHNGIDDALEEKSYKAQAVNAKFKQQISYGIGAAMVFGLVGVLGTVLKDAAIFAVHAHTAAIAAGTTGAVLTATTVAVAWPVIGLAALGFLGVGLLYLSAKYLSENTVLDQQLQANQICAATRGHTQEVAQGVAPKIETKVEQFPSIPSKADSSELNAAPTTSIGNERELADTVITRTPAKEATKEPLASWTAQMETQANNNASLARTA